MDYKNPTEKVNKTSQNNLKAVSKYQKKNPEKCREKCRNYYNRLKQDPERYQKYLLSRRNYRKNKKLQSESSEINV